MPVGQYEAADVLGYTRSQTNDHLLQVALQQTGQLPLGGRVQRIIGELRICLHFFDVLFNLAVKTYRSIQRFSQFLINFLLFAHFRQRVFVRGTQDIDFITQIGNPGFHLRHLRVVIRRIENQLVVVIRGGAGGFGGAAFLH